MSPYTSDHDYAMPDPGWSTFKALLSAPFKGLLFILFLPLVGFIMCFMHLMELTVEAFEDAGDFLAERFS